MGGTETKGAVRAVLVKGLGLASPIRRGQSSPAPGARQGAT